MKLYHVYVHIMGISSKIHKNLSHNEALVRYVCPFVNQEVTMLQGEMYNISQWGIVNVFETDKPIDSSWPIKEKEHEIDYVSELRRHLWDELGANVTEAAFRDAIRLTASGNYKAIKLQVAEKFGRKESFFICPMDNEEVNHNYEYVIKPMVRQYHFEIHRVDEIAHTQEINSIILDAIAQCKFVIADLTDVRPNCYYELGYAHALRKPVVIIAKKGTQRHFDISMYKWNYWESYKDLKATIEKELGDLMQHWSKETNS